MDKIVTTFFLNVIIGIERVFLIVITGFLTVYSTLQKKIIKINYNYTRRNIIIVSFKNGNGVRFK